MIIQGIEQGTIDALCRDQGLKLNPRFRVSGHLTVLHLVSEGLGITLASRAEIEKSPDRDGIFVLPHFRATVPLSLGFLESRSSDPAIAAMRDTVLQVWSEPEVAVGRPLPSMSHASGRGLNRSSP